MSLKPIPQQINVFLNGQPAKKGNLNLMNGSYHIDGIQPGEYQLAIKADGYKDWSKKIHVTSGLATEFWNIVLVKNDYPRADYNAAGINKYFLDPKDNLAALAETANNNEFLVNVVDLGSGEIKNVFSSLDYSFYNDEKENIEWSANKKIIIPVEKNGVKFYFIVDTETNEAINLKDIASDTAWHDVRWDPVKKDFLYYVSDNHLFRTNLNNLEDKKEISSDITSYDFAGENVYYLSHSNNMVYRANPNDSVMNPTQITTSAPGENDDYKIIVYDDNRIAFLGNANLYIYNKGSRDTYFEKIFGSPMGAQFSNDGKKLLFWNNSEISVYFTRDWDVQPWRQENDQHDITRFSQKINNVQWAKDYEHIIFNVDQKIKMIEIDNRYELSPVDITNLNSDETVMSSDFSRNKIFFIDRNGNNNSQLYSIDFPEKSTFLGF